MNELTLNPRTELRADTMRVLTPAERWVWVGLRMLATKYKDGKVHGIDIPIRLNTPEVVCNMAIHKLIQIGAITVRKGILTIHHGYNPGDRVREQIIYHVIKYINWRMKKQLRTGDKFMRINMRTRINEGAELNHFKKVIAYTTDHKPKEYKKMFQRDGFWDIVETK